MHWKFAYPSHRTSRMPWITDHIPPERHDFELIPADYAHDRSRPSTSGRQWLDYLRHAWRAWRAADRDPRRPVGILTAFPHLAVGSGLIKRLTFSRRPIVVWSFNLGTQFTGWKLRLARFALAKVDVFISHSRRETEIYPALLGLDAARFAFVPFSVAPLAPELAEDEEHPFVLAMGTARRDYRSLVAALSELGLPGVIVAGPHALEGIEIPGNVQVRSNLTLAECHALSQRARVNVVPVDNDDTASGQVTIVETMMLGRAVVATRCIGSEDYLVDGETGLLVPPHDAAALAVGIDRLWNDGPFRRRLDAAARAHAVAHFDFVASVEPLSALLDRAARNA